MKTFEQICELTKKEYLELSKKINGKSLNNFLSIIERDNKFDIMNRQIDYIDINGDFGAYSINIKNGIVELSEHIDVIDDESNGYWCGLLLSEL